MSNLKKTVEEFKIENTGTDLKDRYFKRKIITFDNIDLNDLDDETRDSIWEDIVDIITKCEKGELRNANTGNHHYKIGEFSYSIAYSFTLDNKYPGRQMNLKVLKENK
jgi:hypothetical protein